MSISCAFLSSIKAINLNLLYLERVKNPLTIAVNRVTTCAAYFRLGLFSGKFMIASMSMILPFLVLPLYIETDVNYLLNESQVRLY